MTRQLLAAFKAGSKRYEHTLCTTSDMTYIHDVESNQRIFNSNEGGWVFNKHGWIAGRFARSEATGCWFYKALDGSTRINTKFNDKLEAEQDVFSVLLRFGYRE